jgi:galactonate dehydratase
MLAFAPHCPLGPLALASCLHVDFVARNAVFQEQSMGIHYNQGAELLDYVLNKEDFQFPRWLHAAADQTGPGGGDQRGAGQERSKTAPDWRNPVWRHADGAVAEW